MSSTSVTNQKLDKVTMYTTRFCPYCVAAKQLLDSKGIGYEEIDVGSDPQRRMKMEELSRRRTVPQIFSGDMHIGGYTDLLAFLDK